MKRISMMGALLLVLALALFAGCGGSSDSNANAPLNANNINLIFVVSPDLTYNAPGDIQPDTANLTNQGLQRSLRMATYLKTQVLGTKNVTGIYALAPMTHLQTANNYPDMAAIGYIQPFALQNQITISGIPANSYPINTAYGPGDNPVGVIEPSPYATGAQGLVFNDVNHNNLALVTRIITAGVSGFHVFSAPWQTISALMADINNQQVYNLNLPASYAGPNIVYAISIPLSGGNARLVTFDSKLNPPATYPALPPPPIVSASCTQQDYFSYTLTDGVGGVKIPTGANINQTVYLIRHAEAHPASGFEDGNFIGAGQWRALSLPNYLPNALRGQPTPTAVYSIDPAQSFILPDDFSVSYVRPSLTVLPYAIFNNLPYYLVSNFYIGLWSDSGVAQSTSDFLFTGGNLSGQTILLAWEHLHYPPLISYLLQTYGVTVPVTALPWPQDDYDTIWTVKLDGQGNLTVNNALCEGINSATLPKTAPQF